MINKLSSIVGLLFFLCFSTSFVEIQTPAVNEIEDEILVLINQHRNSKGKSDLVMNETIREVARKHSQNMASGAASFGHDGFEFRGVQIAKQITFSRMAENVALNYSGGPEAVDQWIKSSGHHKNMLGAYQKTGIGVARKGNIFYFTQIFTD